jgi:hypothetical protein
MFLGLGFVREYGLRLLPLSLPDLLPLLLPSLLLLLLPLLRLSRTPWVGVVLGLGMGVGVGVWTLQSLAHLFCVPVGWQIGYLFSLQMLTLFSQCL